LGLPLVAVTFDPHPMTVVGPRHAPTSLAALPYRIELLRQAGADDVCVLPFDEAMAALSPSQFMERVLVGRLAARAVVVGEDFRFGQGAAGTVQTMIDEGAALGLSADGVALVGDGSARWSSTRTRDLIDSGDVVGAADVLGRLYRLDGIVVHGDHRGRELGYPTANLAWEGTPTVPADGVYAGRLAWSGERLPAAISVGTNPTFDGTERRVEAFVLDRADLDLYGEQVGVEFAARIRGMERFDSVEALVQRMALDVEESRRILGT
jgi:riboflavin kinase/FMN adenylyltransferase